MTWRWDDAAYAAAEDHGQHVEGSLDWYPGWNGALTERSQPNGSGVSGSTTRDRSVSASADAVVAAGEVLLAAIDSVLELLPDYALRDGSTVHVRAEEAGDSIVHSATHSSADAPAANGWDDRDEWPIHQPGPAYEAPIPGVHWYGGCEPGYPRVRPDGVCEGCGERACPSCGLSNCPNHGPLVAA